MSGFSARNEWVPKNKKPTYQSIPGGGFYQLLG